jgi:hypothetical protein
VRRLFLLVMLTLVGGLVSCQSTQSTTTGNSSKASRSTRTKTAYQEKALREVVQKADDFIQSGIRYYNSGQFQDAMLQFIEAYRLIERYEATVPMVRGRMNRIKGYLGQIHAKHSSAVIRYVNGLIERGTKLLNMQMLDTAEVILESIKRWQPNLRNEVDTLLLRVRNAKRQVRRALGTA